jgi:predicted dinucleotide-binding enzyme
MNVGVLGSGQVAQVLAAGFRKKGHAVTMGSRDPQKLAAFAAQEQLETADFGATARAAELVVLAVKGTAALAALELAGADALAGKIVIDTTNPIEEVAPERGVLRFFTGPNDSLMERLQTAYPKARFVKAWNSVGNVFMVDPDFNGATPTMFICGDDTEAKRVAGELLASFGWESADMGSSVSARALEPLCQLWCAPGLLRGEWTHAFKLLRK